MCTLVVGKLRRGLTIDHDRAETARQGTEVAPIMRSVIDSVLLSNDELHDRGLCSTLA